MRSLLGFRLATWSLLGFGWGAAAEIGHGRWLGKNLRRRSHLSVVPDFRARLDEEAGMGAPHVGRPSMRTRWQTRLIGGSRVSMSRSANGLDGFPIWAEREQGKERSGPQVRTSTQGEVFFLFSFSFLISVLFSNPIQIQTPILNFKFPKCQN
jgi:hypothetical protein